MRWQLSGQLDPLEGIILICVLPQVEPDWHCDGGSSASKSHCFQCGDGVRQGKEQCDDGATSSGDGCSSDCRVEPGHVCASSTEFAPSICQLKQSYHSTVSSAIQENEARCKQQTGGQTFVVTNPVSASGKCVTPSAVNFNSAPVQLVEHTVTLGGAPLSLSSVSTSQALLRLQHLGQVTISLNKTTQSATQGSPESNTSELLIDLTDSVSKSSLAAAVCLVTNSAVCGITPSSSNHTLPDTFCVDQTFTRCKEVCVQSPDGCDHSIGGVVVLRPFLSWVSDPVCCYPGCNPPETLQIVGDFCPAYRQDLVDISSHTNEEAVVMLDDSEFFQPAEPFKPITAIVDEGPVSLIVWDGSTPSEQLQARAHCELQRTEQCHPGKPAEDQANLDRMDDNIHCSIGTITKCKEVIAAESLCQVGAQFGGKCHTSNN